VPEVRICETLSLKIFPITPLGLNAGYPYPALTLAAVHAALTNQRFYLRWPELIPA